MNTAGLIGVTVICLLAAAGPVTSYSDKRVVNAAVQSLEAAMIEEWLQKQLAHIQNGMASTLRLLALASQAHRICEHCMTL